MNCPATVTLASPLGGDANDVTIQCEQIVPAENSRHERTHSATVVGMTTLVMDGERRAVSVNVYLVW